jgi:hypothetical protein
MAIPFIGKRMTRAEFESYLRSLKFTSSFQPSFVTLHHTASPNLAQRPQGFTAQHLQNLREYYETTLGWSGAPHVFIDDQGDGIIVFQRMDRRGVHAVSFNRNSWGVEMLGDFDTESFTTGRGAKVRDNAMQALAIMCKVLNVSASTIKFHRDDPKTTKTCPGRNVTKQDVVERVSALLNENPPKDTVEHPNEMSLVLPNGSTWENTRNKDNRLIVRARDFLKTLDAQSDLYLQNNYIIWNSKMGQHWFSVAEIDENNNAWIYVRDIADALAWNIEVAGRQVILSD